MSDRDRSSLAVALVLCLTAAVAVVTVSQGGSSAAEPSRVPVWGAEFMATNKTVTRTEAVRQAQHLDLIAATRYTYQPYVADMKAANPDLTLLVYLNGAFAQSDQGTTYPADWYQRDAQGNKVRSLAWGNYLMDPTNPGWVNDVAQRCVTFLASSGYDGCILDVLGTAPINPSYVTGLPVDPTTNKPYTAESWLKATTAVAAATSRSVTPNPVFGNGIMFGSNYFGNPGGTRQLLAGLDGGMAELFMRTPTSSLNTYRTETQWKQDVDMLTDVAAQGRTLITTTKVWTTGTQQQYDQWHRYALASFLLGYQPGSSYFTFRYDKSATNEHSYWQAPIGDPAGPYAKLAGVYQRTFSNGRVVVNPGTTSLTVDLGGRYTTLTGATVNSLTLPPHTGEVLVSASAPDPTPTAPDPTPTAPDPTPTAPDPQTSTGIDSPPNPATPVMALDYLNRRTGPVTEAEAIDIARRFDVIAAGKDTFVPFLDQMRDANSDLVILAYENAVFAGVDRTNHPSSWYLTNCAGNRLRNARTGTWLMDIRPFAGRWFDNRVAAAQRKLSESGYDGIFLDVLSAAPTTGSFVRDEKTGDLSRPSVPGSTPCAPYQASHWTQLTAELAAALQTATGGPVYGNGLAADSSAARASSAEAANGSTVVGMVKRRS